MPYNLKYIITEKLLTDSKGVVEVLVLPKVTTDISNIYNLIFIWMLCSDEKPEGRCEK